MLYIYMVTFTIHIPQMLAYIPYMDPMGMVTLTCNMSISWDFLLDPVDNLSKIPDPFAKSGLWQAVHLDFGCLSWTIR